MHKGIVFWSLIIICTSVQAQNFTLSIETDEQQTYTLVGDSLGAVAILQKQVTLWRGDGHLAASLDSLRVSNDTFFALISKGEQYQYMTIREHNLGKGYLPEKENVTMSLGSFQKLQETVISSYEIEGYPFANIQLVDPLIYGDTLSADLHFYPYIKFVYDSIIYLGNSTISKKYISKYLGIEEGSAYNELDVKDIDKKLRNLPLVKHTRSSSVVFKSGLVRVMLFVDDVVTDRVDGVVGLAPNSANTKENSLLITGEVNVELNNLFKSGKQLDLHWRNYLQRSQKLDVGFTYPYILNTNLGINGEFNLDKFDTVFVNLKSKLSFRYQQKGNNYLQFYYQNISSNLITADTNSVRSRKRIPSNNPYKIDNYGLALFQRDYDYLPNPRKGHFVLADFAIGRKTILRNTEINGVKFYDSASNSSRSLYDTLDLKSIRLNISLKTSLYVPVKKRGTVYQSVELRGLLANDIFFNELYRFGGFSTLRGFDENEIFASKMLSYTIEYRYLIGENSNVGLFFNAAAIENTLRSNSLIYDIPYGFGAVANIQVGKGILNLAYALGTQQGNAIQLNTAKFHFGVVNYF